VSWDDGETDDEAEASDYEETMSIEAADQMAEEYLLAEALAMSRIHMRKRCGVNDILNCDEQRRTFAASRSQPKKQTNAKKEIGGKKRRKKQWYRFVQSQ